MTATRQSALRVVRDEEVTTGPQRIFCGHCGREPNEEDSSARVCSTCGMGVLLQAPAESAPGPSDPFLVVDGSLTVCALSRAAEKLLGVAETDSVNRHVADLIVPADAEAPAHENLATMLAWAARGDAPPTTVVVRPTNTFGVRLWAQVGPCGPPSAALLVLADEQP